MVIIDDSSSDFFKPTKGLRQGDPLSPIIFLIMVDILGRSISNYVYDGLITSLKSSFDGLNFSHEKIFEIQLRWGNPR